MENIWCFDFDGIIVDIEPRYTMIYRSLMAEYGLKPIGDYWSKRRGGVSEKAVLEISGFPMTHIVEYDEKRLELLESPQYLQLDKLFGDVLELFTYLKSRNIDRWIVTHRSKHDFFVTQLEILEIKDLVSAWKCTKGRRKGLAMINDPMEAQKAKSSFIKSLKQGRQIIVVGDTLSDILAAKESGSIAIGIASGLQEIDILRNAKPNYLFNSMSELFEVIRIGYEFL